MWYATTRNQHTNTHARIHAHTYASAHARTWHCTHVALHNVALHNVALHNVALHNVALHNVALHTVALHNVALHNAPVHNTLTWYLSLMGSIRQSVQLRRWFGSQRTHQSTHTNAVTIKPSFKKVVSAAA